MAILAIRNIGLIFLRAAYVVDDLEWWLDIEIKHNLIENFCSSKDHTYNFMHFILIFGVQMSLVWCDFSFLFFSVAFVYRLKWKKIVSFWLKTPAYITCHKLTFRQCTWNERMYFETALPWHNFLTLDNCLSQMYIHVVSVELCEQCTHYTCILDLRRTRMYFSYAKK